MDTNRFRHRLYLYCQYERYPQRSISRVETAERSMRVVSEEARAARRVRRSRTRNRVVGRQRKRHADTLRRPSDTPGRHAGTLACMRVGSEPASPIRTLLSRTSSFARRWYVCVGRALCVARADGHLLRPRLVALPAHTLPRSPTLIRLFASSSLVSPRAPSAHRSQAHLPHASRSLSTVHPLDRSLFLPLHHYQAVAARLSSLAARRQSPATL